MAQQRGFAISGKASEAGKKGAATVKRLLGRDHYVRMGSLGAAARKAAGVDYAELGRQGAAKRWGKVRAE